MKDIRKIIGLLLCMTISCYMMGEEKKNLNIVFIGNSITQGALLENPRHDASKSALVRLNQIRNAKESYVYMHRRHLRSMLRFLLVLHSWKIRGASKM